MLGKLGRNITPVAVAIALIALATCVSTYIDGSVYTYFV